MLYIIYLFSYVYLKSSNSGIYIEKHEIKENIASSVIVVNCACRYALLV